MKNNELDEIKLVKLRFLNKRIKLLQYKLINESIKLDKELILRVLNKDDLLNDYEIELEINFILKEKHPDYKKDDDNFITTLNEYVKGISKDEECYFWNDEINHNEFKKWENHKMKDDYHCWLFHCLYDHNNLTWDDILNIGEIWTDIKVSYQYFD